MGRVFTEAVIEILEDLWASQRGLLPVDQVRRVTVSDALVDTGQQLGLTKKSVKQVTSATGVGTAGLYGTVRLTIQGRECPLDVMEVPAGVPVLVGQFPLEYLDFVVDLRSQKLVGNPAHSGEQMFELY